MALTAVVPAKQRLDVAAVDRGVAETRSRARALILAGDILVNGEPVRTAGSLVREEDTLSLRARPRFVSRGGDKLAHALERFKIDPTGLVCADLGASTGGFTDCLLQAGAAKVYAVDVGYGQIDDRLRNDGRVVVMERVNARTLQGLPEPVELVVADLSFISLRLIMPAVRSILRPGGTFVPLVKPQFEAGRADVGKGGVVRDPLVHERVLHGFARSAADEGFRVLDVTKSPLIGPAGNVEFLAHVLLDPEPSEPAGPVALGAMITAAVHR